jgi:hypothetical protein
MEQKAGARHATPVSPLIRRGLPATDHLDERVPI